MIFENLFLFESLSEEVVEALLATLSDVQMEVRACMLKQQVWQDCVTPVIIM